MNESMDGRYKVLQPRTKQDNATHQQPAGFLGVDRVAQGPLLRVQEAALDAFPGEIVLGASVTQDLSVQLPAFCTGFRLCNLTGTVFANINQGGARQCFDQDLLSGGNIRSLIIATAAASGVTVQTFGYNVQPNFRP